MKNDLIAVKGVSLANSSYLRDYFALHHTPIHLETMVKEIKNGAIVVIDKEGTESTIPASAVISSIGYIPSPLSKKGKHVHLVGDCNGIGNLRTVIWRAWDVAMKI